MIGESPTEVVRLLLDRHRDITLLTLFEPFAAPLLQERLEADSQTSALVAAGLKIRNELGLPFWDSLLTACFGAGASAIPVLDHARFHNLPPRQTTSLKASAWSTAAVDKAISGLAAGNMLVLSSRVELRTGECRHIPMMDFHVPPTPQNKELTIHIAKALDPKGGYILNSGKSYHFYGKSLLDARGLPAFLGNALLFCPFIDRAWIAHQLIEGACGLRISEKPSGGPIPKLFLEL
jgi:hypothetical protein